MTQHSTIRSNVCHYIMQDSVTRLAIPLIEDAIRFSHVKIRNHLQRAPRRSSLLSLSVVDESHNARKGSTKAID